MNIPQHESRQQSCAYLGYFPYSSISYPEAMQLSFVDHLGLRVGDTNYKFYVDVESIFCLLLNAGLSKAKSFLAFSGSSTTRCAPGRKKKTFFKFEKMKCRWLISRHADSQ